MDTRLKASLTLIHLSLLVFSFYLMIIWILPFTRQYLFLLHCEYTNAYEYKNSLELPNSYYLLNGVIIFKSGKSSKAELLMQKTVDYTEESPFQESPLLSENEVAVSDNLLNREGLKIGDTITVYNPVYERNDQYLISSKISANYGLLTENTDRGFGVIIFGQNKSLIDQYDLKSVVFTSKSFSASENDLAIESLYRKDELMAYCMKQIVYIITITLIIHLIIQILAYAVFIIISSQRLRKLLLLGTSPQSIKKFIFEHYIKVSGTAVIVACITASIIMCLSSVNCFSVIIILLFDVLIMCLLSVLTKLIVKRSLY